MSATLCPASAFLRTVTVMTETVLTVHQTARPHGFPTSDHFAYVESTMPVPGPGTALVENLYWSVDPYHR
ncbi:NADP-dependent oxidoreductase, partial [Streptomyces sp. NPDC091280]